jgi:hypothetical protein
MFSLVTCLRSMQYIFERGIDPHVDDPTQCHVGRGGHS